MLRRISPIVALLPFLTTGCNRAPAPPVVAPDSSNPAAAVTSPANLVLPPVTLEMTPEQRSDAAVWSAFTLLNEGKPPEALAAFRQAAAIQDSEPVRTEIARIEARLQSAADAERAAADIRATLIDGQSAEAGRLAGAALLAFGDSASARLFVSLKRQADTLETIGQNAAVRVARFKKEAEEARATGNLRVAVLALEEAVALSSDADIKQHFEQLNLRVRRYDEALLRAADLRRDPNRLENALAALRDANASEITDLVYSPDGSRLVSASADGFLRIWDPAGGMNPGKVVDPYPITSNLRLGTDYAPPELTTPAMRGMRRKSRCKTQSCSALMSFSV